MQQFLEIPFLSATQLDGWLNARIPALRKYRQNLRQTLDPGIQISIGKAGTVQLNTVAVLDCAAVAARWKQEDARRLEDAYRGAGLRELVESSEYAAALGRVRDKVRSCRVKGSGDLARQIVRCMTELTAVDGEVREVAFALGNILRKLDNGLAEMKRLPGRVVRSEGDETLVVVDVGEREELRSVEGNYLVSLGLQDPGAPFVLHEFRWSPDSTMSLFIPAWDSRAGELEDPDLEKRLKAAESPWPVAPDIPLD